MDDLSFHKIKQAELEAAGILEQAEKKAGELIAGAKQESLGLLEAQGKDDEAYRKKVLPSDVTVRLSVEAASPMGWHKYTGPDGAVLGIERFGASAPYKTIFEQFGLTVENVSATALALLNRKKGLFLDSI